MKANFGVALRLAVAAAYQSQVERLKLKVESGPEVGRLL
jgi:hypothetical protein